MKRHHGTATIVVLNDGETFTDAIGCKIYDVDANATTEEIEEALKDMDHELSAGRGVILGPDTTIQAFLGSFYEDGGLYSADGEVILL